MMNRAIIIKRVENLLSNIPATRNSDFYLILQYAQIYHDVYGLSKLYDLAIENKIPLASITRSRRKLQAKGMYLPTEQTSKRRRKQQLEHHEFYRQGGLFDMEGMD